MILRAVMVAALAAAPAAADPMYPAAKCASFWLGWTDAARRSAYLDATPSDAGLAARFRQAALDDGGDPARVDAFLERDRADMSLMIRAAIAGDRQSRDVQDRLMETCGAYARDHGF